MLLTFNIILIVFDLIIPIVDYTNFAIMGITCAVAWELPSKPPSEIIENFRTKLNDGTFGLIRRNDSTQQPLVFINSPRTEQDAIAQNKRWGENFRQASLSVYNQNYQPSQQQRMPVTVANSSGHQNSITNVIMSPTLKEPLLPAQPPSSNFYYNRNSIQPENFQSPTATTSFYNQKLEQKTWNNYNNNLKTFDANQRKTFYAANNNRRRPISQKNDFTFSQPKNYYNNYNSHNNFNKFKTYTTANKGNVENWRTKNKYQNTYEYHQTHYQQQQKPSQYTKLPYNDAGDYTNRDKWWDRNRDRIEKHWQESEHKWPQYQEKYDEKRKKPQNIYMRTQIYT